MQLDRCDIELSALRGHSHPESGGDDQDWDVNRVVRVDRVCEEVQAQRGVTRWQYSLDFNERCPDVNALMTFLQRLRRETPGGFERIA